jgi:hypothetical protein
MARPRGGPFSLNVMWQVLAGFLLTVALAILLMRRTLRSRARTKATPAILFAESANILQDPEFGHGETVGSYVLTGRYNGRFVQVRVLTDTLAVRKLPSQWLMVTIPEPLPVGSVFDLMLRPAGPLTFSNFDQLAHTLPLPAGYPEDAVIRTDNRASILNPAVVASHLPALLDSRSKELLITPNGLRLVTLLAEADRLRYGVLRQAEFGNVTLAPELLQGIIVRLLSLRDDIIASESHSP